jgi:hypothetical protein
VSNGEISWFFLQAGHIGACAGRIVLYFLHAQGSWTRFVIKATNSDIFSIFSDRVLGFLGILER